MNKITVEVSPETARRIGNKKSISQMQFREILEQEDEKHCVTQAMKDEFQKEDFTSFTEMKKLLTIQKVLRSFGLNITNEEKLLHFKQILENEQAIV